MGKTHTYTDKEIQIRQSQVDVKDSSYLKIAGVGKLDLTATFSNPDNDPNGPWASKPWKVGSDQSGSKYTIVSPKGTILEGEWMGEEATYKKFLKEYDGIGSQRDIYPELKDVKADGYDYVVACHNADDKREVVVWCYGDGGVTKI